MPAQLQTVWQELLATSYWEITAVVLALSYVLLTVRRNLWCWPCAFASASIYLVLMARAGLVMQSVLQCFYMVMAVYGFFSWRRGMNQAGAVEVVHWPLRWHLWAIGCIVMLAAVNAAVLTHAKIGQNIVLDVLVTWGSVVATWLVTRRVLENWLYWWVSDAMAVYLYFSQGLKATALLFLIYMGIALHGYMTWRRQYRLQQTAG